MGDYEIRYIVNALERMSRANWFLMASNPELCAGYAADIRAGRWQYEHDRVTCGYPDCWSTYACLRKRYPEPQKIKFDCEDIACAHAGWMASQCPGRHKVYIGLVPGKRISHAIAGYRRDDTIRIIDPSRWFGMPPTQYENIHWKEVW